LYTNGERFFPLVYIITKIFYPSSFRGNLVLAQTNGHEGGEDSQKHLGLNLNDILGESENDGTDLTGRGDGVLGVLEEILLVVGVEEHTVVDGARAEGIDEVGDRAGVLDTIVLEARDGGGLAGVAEGLIDPGDNLVIRDLLAVSRQSGEDVKHVGAHHLPDNGQSEGLVGLVDIVTGNTDKREVKLLTELNGVVAVLELLHVTTHGTEGRLVNLGPVDDTGLDLIEQLQEDETITEIFVQGVDIRGNTERVHPVSEGLLLAGLLNNLDNLLNGLKSREVVEQVGDEGQVELGVTSNDVGGTDELAAVHLVSLLKHLLSALAGVRLAQSSGINTQVLGGDLLEEDGVGLRVLDVTTEVVDALRVTGGTEVIVDPTDENLVRWELEEILNGLSGLEETVELRVVLQVDLGQETNANNLPDETKGQVGDTIDQVLTSQVNNVDTNGLGGVDNEGLVLVNLEDGQLTLVDDTLINSVGDGIVDKLAVSLRYTHREC
jgi:hypothetical protein